MYMALICIDFLSGKRHLIVWTGTYRWNFWFRQLFEYNEASIVWTGPLDILFSASLLASFNSCLWKCTQTTVPGIYAS